MGYFTVKCDYRQLYLSFKEPLVDDDHSFEEIIMFLVSFVHFFAHVNEMTLDSLVEDELSISQAWD